MSIYDFSAVSIDGELINLSDYKGKVLIIVNTASKCGFTPQYAELEKIYTQYKDQGLEILGFPCNQFAEQEPGTNTEVKKFCELNYGVSFQLFEKINVRDENIHPLFAYLTENTHFNGFGENNPASDMLSGFLKEKFPHYLEGDSIKWNFTKFLIDKEGNIAGRYEPTVSPEKMIDDIEKEIKR